MLRGVSFSANLQVSVQPEESRTSAQQPKFSVKCKMDSVEVMLSQEQFQTANYIADSLSQSQENIELEVCNLTFKKICKPEVRDRYIALYIRTLNALWRKPLSKEEEAEIALIEQEFNFASLSKCRGLAIVKLRSELRAQKKGIAIMKRADAEEEIRKNKAKKSFLSGTLKSMFSWGRNSTSSLKPSTSGPASITTDEKKLYKSLEIDPIEELKRAEAAKRERKADNCQIVVSLALQSLIVSLLTPSLTEAALAKATGVSLRAEINEGNNVIEARLGGFTVVDNLTRDTVYKHVVVSNASTVQTDPIFDMKVHYPPLDMPVDAKISLKWQRADIIVNTELMSYVTKFFTPQSRKIRRKKESVIENSVHSQDEIDTDAPQYTADFRPWLDVEIFAPNLIFPSKLTDANSIAVVASLGHFKLSTNLDEKVSNGYVSDEFRITGSEVELFETRGGQNWKEYRQSHAKKARDARENMIDRKSGVLYSAACDLMPPVKLIMEVHQRSCRTPFTGIIASDSPKTVATKVKLDIKSMVLSLNPGNVKNLSSVAQCIQSGWLKHTKKRAKKAKLPNLETDEEWKQTFDASILESKTRIKYSDVVRACRNIQDQGLINLLRLANGKDAGVDTEVVAKWWTSFVSRSKIDLSVWLVATIEHIEIQMCRNAVKDYYPNIVRVVTCAQKLKFEHAAKQFEECSKFKCSRFWVVDMPVEEKGRISDLVTIGPGSSVLKETAFEMENQVISKDAPYLDEWKAEHSTKSTQIFNIRLGEIHANMEPHRLEVIAKFISDELSFETLQPSEMDIKSVLRAAHNRVIPLIFDNIGDDTNHYLLLNRKLRLNLRSEPTTDSKLKSGFFIEPGTIFKAVDRLDHHSGQTFLKVATGRNKHGWAFMRHPGDKSDLIIPLKDAKVTRADYTDMDIRLKWNKIIIDFAWKDKQEVTRNVGRMSICDFHVTMLNYRFSFDTKISLGNALVEDLTEFGKNNRNVLAAGDMLGSTHDSKVPFTWDERHRHRVFEAEFSSHSPRERCYPGYKTGIKGRIQGATVVYTQRFLDECLAFMNIGPLKRLRSSPESEQCAEPGLKVKNIKSPNIP